MDDCVMCQERPHAEGSQFCGPCVQELNADLEYDRRHFDAEYEIHTMTNARDPVRSFAKARQDFPEETRASVLEHRKTRIARERRETR